MNRRTFLAGTAVALSGLAGCLTSADEPDTDDGTSTPDDTDSVPVPTGHTVSDHVVAPDVERTSETDAWGLFLATSEAAAGYSDAGSADAVEVHVSGSVNDPDELLIEAER